MAIEGLSPLPIVDGRQEPRRYVRKLKSGGWGVYSTVVNLHGYYKTEDEARRAARERA